MEQNAFDLGEEHLTLRPIITGASVTEFACSFFHCAMDPVPASPNPISSSGSKSPSLPLHMLSKLLVGLDGGWGGIDFCNKGDRAAKTEEALG